METKLLSIHSELNTKLIEDRNLTENEWIEKNGSSTLRRAKKMEAAYKNLYIHERVCWEFGFNFDIAPRSRVTFGDAFTEGDCHFITEGQYIADRYINKRNFTDDWFEWKYIIISNTNSETIDEGLGLILRETTCSWLPSGNIIYAIIVTCKNKIYEKVNPI